MVLTGIRRGEVAGLEFGDLQEEKDLLTIRRAILYTPESGVFQKQPKTESSYRTFLISPWVKSIILDYKQWYQDNYNVRSNLLLNRKLFCQDDGKPIHPDNLTIWCRKFCDSNPSIPRFTPHVLRHQYVKYTTKKYCVFSELFLRSDNRSSVRKSSEGYTQFPPCYSGTHTPVLSAVRQESV